MSGSKQSCSRKNDDFIQTSFARCGTTKFITSGMCKYISNINCLFCIVNTIYIGHKLHLNREQKGAQGQQDMHNEN
jgi:hypothetical protein